MATRIVTSNKDDIVTGFDIHCDKDLFEFLRDGIDNVGGKLAQVVTNEVLQGLIDANKQALVDWMNDNIDDAEEIFIEEASLSRWSGNMIDNSVCGVSGTMPQMIGNTLFVDVRVGVNHEEIMNPANWDSHANKFYGKSARYVNPTIYTYDGYRMHQPFVDYSIFLNTGTAKIPNAAAWAGFVGRAEERFWA